MLEEPKARAKELEKELRERISSVAKSLRTFEDEWEEENPEKARYAEDGYDSTEYLDDLEAYHGSLLFDFYNLKKEAMRHFLLDDVETRVILVPILGDFHVD